MCERDVSRRAFISGGLGAAAFVALPGAFTLPPWAELLESDRPNLDLAIRAWSWIDSHRVVTSTGWTWPANPLEAATLGDSLYSDAPGIVPFALELFHSTGDEQYLEAAGKACDHFGGHLDEIQGSGLYVGLGGIAFIATETHKASGDARHADLAHRATDLIIQRSEQLGRGRAWRTPAGGGEYLESNDMVSGTAGAGLTLLYLSRELKRDDALELASAAGRRMVELSTPMTVGRKWDMWPGYAREMPNFSHGTAGMAYFLATLAGETRSSEALDAAVDGARYLQSIADVDGDSYLIHHNSPEGLDLYYLSWCHGPVGTSRLFWRLHEQTGATEWLDWVHMGARGILGTGVPEQRTPGFWENVSQCGGNAGLGEFYLTLQRMYGTAAYGDFVQRLNDDLLGRTSEQSKGVLWTQSEHRVRPELLVAQTGFMQGAAGIGKYFLHVDSMEETGAAPTVILPDAPY